MVENKFDEKLTDAILSMEDEKSAAKVVEEALRGGLDPGKVMEALAAAGEKIGDLFAANTIFMIDLILAGEAMRGVTEVVRTAIGKAEVGRRALGKVVIGTVGGDIHYLGKNLVSTMLTASGFDVKDIGTNCSPDKFLDEVEGFGADVLGLSCLLTSCLPGVKRTIELLSEEGIREKYRVIVGGGALTEKIAADMGADSYGENAMVVVDVVKQLLRR